MPKPHPMTERLRLECDVELSAASEPGKSSSPRKFRMIAYSGKIMNRFGEAFAVDLEGIHWGERPLPILLEHNPGVRLAVATGVSKEDGPLILEGSFLSNPAAREIVADADAGFPFQASIGIEGEKIEEVGRGASVMVNGQSFAGPGQIMRKGILREVSFCALGLDSETSAEALSRRGNPMANVQGSSPTPPAPAPADGVAKFKARLEKLRKAAVLPRQAELVLKLAAEDTELEDALMALMEDLKASVTALEETVQASIDAKGGGEGEGEEAPAPAPEGAAASKQSAASAEMLELVARLRGASTAAGAPTPLLPNPKDLKAVWAACPEGSGIKEEFSSFETFAAFHDATDRGLAKIFAPQPEPKEN